MTIPEIEEGKMSSSSRDLSLSAGSALELPLRDAARAFAIERHGEQRYGNGPYRIHLSAVEQVLADFGFVADHWRAAAWLHDVIEDTQTHPDTIARTFGDRVAAMVWAVTGEGDTRAARVGSVLAKLRLRPAACALKVADRIANVEAASDQPEHLLRYRLEQQAFARVCKGDVPVLMWARLERALNDPLQCNAPVDDVPGMTPESSPPQPQPQPQEQDQ